MVGGGVIRLKDLKKVFYRNNSLRFVLTVIFSAIAVVASILYAKLLQELFDIASKGEKDKLMPTIIFFIILFSVHAISNFIAIKFRWSFVKKAMINYKCEAFKRISNKNISSFMSEKTSSYLSILSNDAVYISDNYLSANFQIIILILFFFGALAAMFIYSYILTLVVIASVSVPILLSMAFGKKIAETERKVSDKNEGFMGLVKDLLGGFTVIKSFRVENRAIELFKGYNEDVEHAREWAKIMENTLNFISGEIASILQIFIFIVGTVLSLNGFISVGVVLAFVQLMNNIIEPVQELPTYFAKRKAASALIEKMENYSCKNEIQDGKLSVDNFNEMISLRNVNFSYDGEKKVLKDINLDFEKNKSYVLVGESGSGKSTILKLLLRAYLNYEGSIYFDEKELKNIESDSLYKIISIIQQDVFIFNGSIRDNISLYEKCDDDKLLEVVRMAGLQSLIDKKGLDFICGENGVNLSGGERQRISIARVLMKESRILLMDEATAALDKETARDVMDNILNLNELTRIAITHNIERAELEKFDEIIVLKDGMVVERGKYEELIENKEYFYALCSIGLEG